MEYKKLCEIVAEDLDHLDSVCYRFLEYCSTKGHVMVYEIDWYTEERNLGMLYDLVFSTYKKELQEDICWRIKIHKEFKISIAQYQSLTKGLAVIYRKLLILPGDAVQLEYFLTMLSIVKSIMVGYWEKEKDAILREYCLDYPGEAQKFLRVFVHDVLVAFPCYDECTEFSGCIIGRYCENILCKAMSKTALDVLKLPLSAAFIARILETANKILFEYVEKNDVPRETIDKGMV